MLEVMGDKIDAVTVSTPDHSHAPAAMAGLKRGKHVFCQKPLTWSVSEARMLRETANDKKVATQMGNQGTAKDGFREGVEVLKSGALGTVSEVHIWTNRPIWPQGSGRPKEEQQVPSNVHWDLFLGPAQFRPYHSAYHPFKWRGWLDFGTGALGDMACHTCNLAVMGLDLFDPISIEATSSGIVENETYPSWSVIEFQFPQRGNLPPCTLTWYDGGKKPPKELLLGSEQKDSGSLIVGDKGRMYSPDDYGSQQFLLPEEKFKDFKKPEPSLPRSPGHFAEFANACRGGSPAMSNFNYSARLTETILLGNVALKVVPEGRVGRQEPARSPLLFPMPTSSLAASTVRVGRCKKSDAHPWRDAAKQFSRLPQASADLIFAPGTFHSGKCRAFFCRHSIGRPLASRTERCTS